jgi:hypothetical protein
MGLCSPGRAHRPDRSCEAVLRHFVVGVHCAAHKLQLAAKDFEKDCLQVAVMSLVQAGYSFFSGSLNRPNFLKKYQAALGLPHQVMLKDIVSRWLSHAKPMERTAVRYAALLLTAEEVNCLPGAQDAAELLLNKHLNFETLLGLTALQPLMDELVSCVKIFQSRVRTI